MKSYSISITLIALISYSTLVLGQGAANSAVGNGTATSTAATASGLSVSTACSLLSTAASTVTAFDSSTNQVANSHVRCTRQADGLHK
eukprot:jgi/Botrbrau1/13430/Bobra.0082s0034.1